jgi:hypothetical protein
VDVLYLPLKRGRQPILRPCIALFSVAEDGSIGLNGDRWSRWEWRSSAWHGASYEPYIDLINTLARPLHRRMRRSDASLVEDSSRCWNINHLMLHESVASNFSTTVGDPSCMLLRQRQQGYEIFSQHRIVHFGDGHWIKLFSRSAAINCHLYVSNGSVLGVKSE